MSEEKPVEEKSIFVDPDVEEVVVETEIEDDKVEAEEPKETETEAEPQEEAEEKTGKIEFTDDQQAFIDSLVSNRLAARDAKYQRERELWEQQQANQQKSEEEKEVHRRKLVKKAVDDGLIEASDELAQPKEINQPKVTKTYNIDSTLTQESYMRAMNKLTLSALDSGISDAQLKAIDSEIGLMMQQDAVPIDIIPEASKHNNGVAIIKKLITDNGFKESVVIAGLKAKQSGNIEDFRVEFNKLADGIGEVKEESVKPTEQAQPKKKIEPSKREHLAPTGTSSNDDEVDVPIAKW